MYKNIVYVSGSGKVPGGIREGHFIFTAHNYLGARGAGTIRYALKKNETKSQKNKANRERSAVRVH